MSRWLLLATMVFAGCAIESAPEDEGESTESSEALRLRCRVDRRWVSVGTEVDLPGQSCVCKAGGRLVCSPTCEYGGETYRVGENFRSLDGCNVCSCGASEDATTAYVFCTKLACAQ